MENKFEILHDKFGKLLNEYIALSDVDEKQEKLKEMEAVNIEIEKEMQNIDMASRLKKYN